MKKFNFKTLILFIFSIILITSCSENEMSESKSDLNSEGRSRFNMTSISTKKEAHKAFAFAFSKLMENNQSAKTLIVNKLVPEVIFEFDPNPTSDPVKRINEVLIYKLVNNVSIKNELNTYLSQLSVFNGISDPCTKLLEKDHLLSIYVPYEIINAINFNSEYNNSEIYHPTVVLNFPTDEQFLFFNGEQHTQPNENMVNGFYIGTAQNYHLVDLPDYKDCDDPNLNLFNHMSEKIKNCSAVISKINSLPYSTIRPTCKVVSMYDDVLKVYYTQCEPIVLAGSLNTNLNSPAGGGPLCHRAEYRKQYSWNQNKLHSIGFNWGAYFNFDNQPCVDGGESVFNFQLDRTYHINKQPTLPTPLRYDLLKNQILDPGKPKGTLKFKWSWWCFCNKPYLEFTTLNAQTVQNSSLWVIMPYLKFLNLGNNDLFTTANQVHNNWQPDNQGDIVHLKLLEVDNVSCSSNTSSSTTNNFSFNLGGPITFGTWTGNFGLTWGTSSSYQKTYTVNAAAIVTVADFDASFCQDFYWHPFNENQSQWQNNTAPYFRSSAGDSKLYYATIFQQ